jgi:hypothetical protein
METDNGPVSQFLHKIDKGEVSKENMRSIWRNIAG